MEYSSLKIPITYRSAPYVYIKINNNSKRYRLSCNYKYLNEHYGLKMKFIRDLDNIYYPINKYFNIVDNEILINNDLDSLYQTWDLGSDENTLKITRILNDDVVFLILHRVYDGEYDYSIFYGSKKYNTINELLGA